MKIFCIIAAYNEEKNIAKVVKGVKPLVFEAVVVNDCSSDNTQKLAKDAGATIINHPINRGQGAALQTGNEYALKSGADIIVHFDGDDQFLAEEIKDMIDPIISKRADIVFGSRFLGKEANFPFFKKHIIYPLAQLFTRFVLGIKLSDPQCGFRALNRKAAKHITIENREMAHNSEIQAKAFASDLKIEEVPITVIYHGFGQKLSGGFKIIKDLFINKLSK
ncbi:MAG: glycosyltransferase family 2 protein [Patescibacteria group bacterium]|jgi:glycosyltransferase involved in cell wall biosynthesis|nr:glycosyltransferase family 2 protein [Patescibacteria group bacterium]